MSEASMQNIMREMAQRLQTAHDAPQAVGLDVAARYASVDTLLGDLYKRYLEACRNLEKVAARHGDRAPMTEIAADMRDSALCAFETRLLELRQCQNAALAAAQKAEEEARLLSASSKTRQAAAQTAAFSYRQQLAEKARRAGEDSFLMVLFLLWMLRSALRQTEYNLSIAGCFAGACLAPQNPHRAD